MVLKSTPQRYGRQKQKSIKIIMKIFSMVSTYVYNRNYSDPNLKSRILQRVFE